jgi:hypothetical protein
MQTIDNVVENRFNLGIIRYQTVYEDYFLNYLKDKNLCYDPLWEFEYLALMSQKHALADSGIVMFDTLSRFVEIVHGDTIIPYLNAADIRHRTQEPQKRIYLYDRCNQFELLSTIPATYMWVSPVPGNLLLRYNLVERKCAFPNNSYKDVLIYSANYTFSALDKKFIEKITASKEEVAERS